MITIDRNLIQKYNQSGPRYTSYPPANLFNQNLNDIEYKKIIKDSNNNKPTHISIYIHIPFCKQLCHFCACSTSVYSNEQLVEKYIIALKKEMEFVFQFIDTKREITQIHFGGGTPNSIKIEYLEQIILKIKQKFVLSNNAEIAIEANPAYLDKEYIQNLYKIGFNRISLGIQDFNLEILKIINREKPLININELVETIKTTGFKSINIDLIYGLPQQTIETFTQNLIKAIELNPERIVTFSYAHVPWVKPAQKLLENYKFPSTEEKFIMLEKANEILTNNEYDNIGIDHFAKKEDELIIAKINKQLHRNFQGYCTKTTTGQVYAFGATAISQLTEAYIQNQKNINKYIKEVELKNFAFERGYKLVKKEMITRDVINEIMCNSFLSLNEIAKQHSLSLEKLIQMINPKIKLLKQMENDGLIRIVNNTDFIVNKNGNYFLRNIAMAFDDQLKIEHENIYSKTI